MKIFLSIVLIACIVVFFAYKMYSDFAKINHPDKKPSLKGFLKTFISNSDSDDDI